MSFRARKQIFGEKSGGNRIRNSVIILVVLLLIFIAVVGAHTYTVYQEQLPVKVLRVTQDM